jgi:casein kinase II subunit alpha
MLRACGRISRRSLTVAAGSLGPPRRPPTPRPPREPHPPAPGPPEMQSRSRVYADVNVNQPREYWDYEALQVEWG